MSSYAWTHGLSVSAEITRRVRPPKRPSSVFELDFEAKTALQQRSAKSAMIMANIDTTADCFQFVRSICKDLENAKDIYSEMWTGETDIMLLASQIKVYASLLQTQKVVQKPPSETTTTLELDISTKAILHCVFSTAVRLIHIFSKLFESSQLQNTTPISSPNCSEPFIQRHLPKTYYRTLLFAASFLIKWMAIQATDFPTSDSDLARNHVRLTYQIMTSLSLELEDEPARAARMIEALSRVHELPRLDIF